MRNVNKVILIGNLTRDPEMRKTLNDQYVTTFGIATNREWITKDGRKQQSVEFHELTCWGRLAEFASNYIKKGNLLYIEGHLKTRIWDDASGMKRFRTEIIIEDLILLEKRPKTDGATPAETPLQESPREELSPSITIEDPFTI